MLHKPTTAISFARGDKDALIIDRSVLPIGSI
jgi:hypothetical protein